MAKLLQKFVGPGTFPIVIGEDSANLALAEIHAVVNTTLGPVTLTLPKIADLKNAASIVELSIFDESGTAATNNITVAANAVDKVNNAASVVLSTNKGILQLEVVNSTNWGAELASSAAPSGGGLAVVGEFFTKNSDAGAPVAASAAFPFFTNSSNNTLGAFTHASPSGNITVNTTGLYDVEADATFAEAGAITVCLDGVPVVGATRGRATGTNGCTVSSLIQITAGQVVSLIANSGNAAALTLTGVGSIGTTDTSCIVTSIKLLKVG